MSLQLLALIVMVVTTGLLGLSENARQRARPGYPLHRLFSVTAVGLLLFVAGLIGCDLSDSRVWFQGTRWVQDPIWWEVGSGFALLLLARSLARRLPWRSARAEQRPGQDMNAH